MKLMKFALGVFTAFLCGACLFSAASQNAPPEIPKDLIQQLIKDINTNENNFRLSDEDLKVLHEHLKFELHDLNGDLIPEFFLYIEHSDWCGAGSNCSYWVYQKKDGGYRLLIEEKVLRVKDMVTNGYKDLASQVPMGFCAVNVQRADVSLYRYDGERYQFVSRKDECIPFTPKE